MILDAVANTGRYRGAHPVVDRALALLSTPPWLKLEQGRHELTDGVHAILSSYTTEAPESGRFEAHREHVDIQLVIQGEETIYWAAAADLQEEGDYDQEADTLNFRDPPGGAAHAVPVRVRPGIFVLLYPEDAHKPGCIWERPEQVLKVVLKVRL